MTRRPGERHRGRLQRMRALAPRPEHGLDYAIALVRPGPADDAPARSLRALAEENALLARELGRVQARCTRWRADFSIQADRLEASLMRARADAIVKQTRIAALEDALRVATTDEAPQAACAPLVACRVLCVGGRARQVPVYQALVERHGGRFDHVDAADPSCLARLRLALADADLVILQPGYACQGACRAVDEHCRRSGVRCVHLDKACAIGFARSLAQAIVLADRHAAQPASDQE